MEPIDAAVSRELVQVLTPAAIEAAAELAQRQTQQEKAELESFPGGEKRRAKDAIATSETDGRGRSVGFCRSFRFVDHDPARFHHPTDVFPFRDCGDIG